MRPCRAFDLARRCFALAASTTFPAERDAAIARGRALIEKNGLKIDRFEIPGQTVAREIDPEDVTGAIDHLAASLRQRRAETGATEDETVYDARRRNFDRAIAAARVRDAARDAARIIR